MFRFLSGDPTGLLQMRIQLIAAPTRPTTAHPLRAQAIGD